MVRHKTILQQHCRAQHLPPATARRRSAASLRPTRLAACTRSRHR